MPYDVDLPHRARDYVDGEVRGAKEALLPDGFISDGSSLQEWIYGAARVRYGMNPGASADLGANNVDDPDEMRFFASVVDQYGHAFRQHVKATFDAFVHLRNELPLDDDHHRPMNERFRATCDEMLLATLDHLRIPYHVISGSLPERLESIVGLFDLPMVLPVDDAIALAAADYVKIDKRLESERERVDAA